MKLCNFRPFVNSVGYDRVEVYISNIGYPPLSLWRSFSSYGVSAAAVNTPWARNAQMVSKKRHKKDLRGCVRKVVDSDMLGCSIQLCNQSHNLRKLIFRLYKTETLGGEAMESQIDTWTGLYLLGWAHYTINSMHTKSPRCFTVKT